MNQDHAELKLRMMSQDQWKMNLI